MANKINQTKLFTGRSAADEIFAGLNKKQKMISSKYFYDSRGSELFDEICRTDEYYLTRTEIRIIIENLEAIAAKFGNNVLMIEFGSGSGIKTKLLLENADINGYIPVDISYEYLVESASRLKEYFPDVKIFPMHADFNKEFQLPETGWDFGKKIIFFPGSTIGNFNTDEARNFLKLCSSLVKPKGGMLLGFDLIKDRRLIENAYNDRGGVTAAFNLNILTNVNSVAEADFNTNNFEHLAFYNESENRIEMHLRSKIDQQVKTIRGIIKIAEGETILTEYSYKYSVDMIKELTSGSFKIDKVWMDKNKFFACAFLK